MQWSIGFSRDSLTDIIKEKRNPVAPSWLPLANADQSIADPFIFKDQAGSVQLLYEDFSMTVPENYGKIALATVTANGTIHSNTTLLDAGSHASYPAVFRHNDQLYIIPETSHQNKVSAFEYDLASRRFTNERILIHDMPLLDSTILQHNGKYWLFATVSTHQPNNEPLHIFYADSLLGPYQPHAANPVKNSMDGCRPAGNFIKVNGEIYRPTQNCAIHYGESISINKITRLSEEEFSEEFYFRIAPDKKSVYNAGIHTINAVDDLVVVDGIRMVFNPVVKWKLFLKKKLKQQQS